MAGDPRIRGEHESSTSRSRPSPGSSPHTRGALGILLAIFIQLGIIPAYAGSTSPDEAIPMKRGDHPRIRGEHHVTVVVAAPGRGSSPHTRGAHAGARALLLGGGIIPAYAGSTPSSGASLPRCTDHPRIRGEHVAGRSDPHEERGSSPHTRGALYGGPRLTVQGRIIPAYAGSTASSLLESRERQDHPRIRGEHVAGRSDPHEERGSSPHTRGALYGGPRLTVQGRIIPAYAGSTASSLLESRERQDHPRIRGEHFLGQRHSRGDLGSSPHTRGAPLPRQGNEIDRGIIPAYAGSTPREAAVSAGVSDHPRIRGEHSSRAQPGHPAGGSSPHTRGARDDPRQAHNATGIIPAYAGSTRTAVECSCRVGDHPRIRGEHTDPHTGFAIARGSSPHTRGAPSGALVQAPLPGIIPAYAGSTNACIRPMKDLRDHPRIRGEHVDPITIGIGQWGSSPHTRGALVLQLSALVELGIIPAYAGSTFI